jgi:hypothetical protein
MLDDDEIRGSLDGKGRRDVRCRVLRARFDGEDWRSGCRLFRCSIRAMLELRLY